jgi:hypothetical protein
MNTPTTASPKWDQRHPSQRPTCIRCHCELAWDEIDDIWVHRHNGIIFCGGPS